MALLRLARKLNQLDAKPSPALDAAIADAIALAEKIMMKIDSRSAIQPAQRMSNMIGVDYSCSGAHEISVKSSETPCVSRRCLSISLQRGALDFRPLCESLARDRLLGRDARQRFHENPGMARVSSLPAREWAPALALD